MDVIEEMGAGDAPAGVALHMRQRGQPTGAAALRIRPGPGEQERAAPGAVLLDQQRQEPGMALALRPAVPRQGEEQGGVGVVVEVEHVPLAERTVRVGAPMHERGDPEAAAAIVMAPPAGERRRHRPPARTREEAGDERGALAARDGGLVEERQAHPVAVALEPGQDMAVSERAVGTPVLVEQRGDPQRMPAIGARPAARAQQRQSGVARSREPEGDHQRAFRALRAPMVVQRQDGGEIRRFQPIEDIPRSAGAIGIGGAVDEVEEQHVVVGAIRLVRALHQRPQVPDLKRIVIAGGAGGGLDGERQGGEQQAAQAPPAAPGRRRQAACQAGRARLESGRGRAAGSQGMGHDHILVNDC